MWRKYSLKKPIIIVDVGHTYVYIRGEITSNPQVWGTGKINFREDLLILFLKNVITSS